MQMETRGRSGNEASSEHHSLLLVGVGQAESELANQTYRLGVKLSEADHVVGVVQ